MTYRYIYKITCTKGKFKDHFYFGQHTTDNLNDGYKGSGKKLCKYYQKYPNDFIMKIVAFYNTQEELNNAEYDIIHPWLNNSMCLNLKEGGIKTVFSDESIKKLSEANKGQIPWSKGKHLSEEHKRRISESTKGRSISEETIKKISETLKGRKASEETRKKMSKSLKGKIPWNKGKKVIKNNIYIKQNIYNSK